MRNILFIAISLFVFASCTFIDSVFYGDVVARVGNSVLYEKDIEGLVPKGTSSKDMFVYCRKSFFPNFLDSFIKNISD